MNIPPNLLIPTLRSAYRSGTLSVRDLMSHLIERALLEIAGRLHRASVSALGAFGVPMPAATAARRASFRAEHRQGAGARKAANT